MAENSVKVNAAPGEYRTCPYDVNHRIVASRMGIHKNVCLGHYRKKMMAKGAIDEAYEVVTCPVNKQHVNIPLKELAYHETYECENSKHNDKEKVEDDWKAYAPKGRVEQLPELEAVVEDQNDWSKDSEHHYDPKNKLKTSFVFYQPKGLSKSEKIAYRKAQKERFYRLQRPRGVMLPGEEDFIPEENPYEGLVPISRASRASTAVSQYEDAEDGPDDYFMNISSDEDDDKFFEIQPQA